MKATITNINGLYNVIVKNSQDKTVYQADMFNDDMVCFMEDNNHIDFEVK